MLIRSIFTMAATCMTSAGLAQEVPKLDLAALIECRADVKDWGTVAFAIMGDPGVPDALGWQSVPAANPFLQEYEIEEPIVAFGRQTTRIALTSSGVVAVLQNIDPARLAAEVNAAAVTTSPTFMAERVISDTVEGSGNNKLRTRISINISTVDTHAGLVLAGCAYAVEPADSGI